MVSPAPSLLADAFARVCRERPSAVAVYALSEGRGFTFDELWGDAGAFERSLAVNLTPGCPVVLLAGNRPAFISALVAALRHGAAVAPLDPGATASEASLWIRTLGARAAVAPAGVRFDGAVSTAPLPHDLVLHVFPERPHAADAGPAVLKITSGSTGVPRAVRCSEENLLADGLHIVEAMGIGPADVNLAVIPLSHSYGLGNLVMPLVLQGSPLALREAFVPERFTDDAARSGATVFPGVPFMFEYLVQRLADRPMAASLRLAITAGASISPAVVAAFKRAFGLKVHSFYGTSETGGITYDADEAIENPLPVGRPMPDTVVTLRSIEEPPESAAPVAPAGGDAPRDGAGLGQGRVHVRGAAVAARYDGPPDGGPSPFCDGGFLTGDLGCFRGGRLVLTGRVSEFVNVAGRKVLPGEVARVLEAMPGVAAALVLGVPCDARGEALLACIVPEGGRRPSVAALRTYCSDRLSSYKIPRHYVFVDALPVDQRGKTDRRALDRLLAEHVRPGTTV
jgi:acyl-CoA synthetase (AMP-forming)/AMP-acid ligase II